MPIATLEICGLRGFADSQTVRFAVPNGELGSGLTMLIGPNNGGKSTVIEALRALSTDAEQSFTEGKRNKQAGDRVSIKITSDSGQIFGLETVATGGSTTTRTQSNPVWHPDLYVLPSRRYFNPHFGHGQENRRSYMRNSGVPQNRGAVLDQFSGRLFAALKKRPDFDSVLKRVLDPLPDWTIDQDEHNQYYLKFNVRGQYHTSDGLGEGIVSLFFIIDALYDASTAEAVVIDEPELSLHPALQRKLAALLAQYATDRQIIYATHSPFFVDFANAINGAKIVRIYKPESSCRICYLLDDTVELLKNFLRNKNNPHILGLDAREALFRDDGIVLVEGQEDVVHYSDLLNQLNLAPEIRDRFYGWGVGGADNMRTIAKMLSDLGFSRVVGILDRNKDELIPELKRKYPKYLFELIPADDVRTKPASSGTNGTLGLIDEQGHLRPEFTKEVRDLFGGIQQYLAGTSS